VIESERAFLALGDVQYGVQASEKKSTLFKRSIYIAKDVQAGETITMEHLKIIRPALGLSPKYLDLVLGRQAKKDITAGTPLSFDLI
jgi:sialic acid synthase SpsE